MGDLVLGLKRALKCKIPPYFLISLNKLNEFYYKMKSKTIK
ncbi:hypothetical protein HPHPP13_0238 [Helicobacter pylori Hp P-13]|uniref:Uncharacterized protein n=1 Tax=Helicobacter pylori Hp P-13b TaxID=992107 RepID=A0ABC9QT91_HELPX|nr:hypothetical protein HPHPP13_0238 [Helicobacter pylori Hp P-13]EJC33561.1 hypothetical protein HPHPP13B_0234 [Helicobacter pylori Hp P-13b]